MSDNANVHDEAERVQAAERPADQVDTPEGKQRVHVVSSFTLLRRRGSPVTYTAKGTNCGLPGYYDMDPDDANHFYTRVHSDNPPEPLPPVPGTQRAVDAQQRVIARRALMETVLDQEEHLATEKVRRGRQAKLKAQLGDSFEQAP